MVYQQQARDAEVSVGTTTDSSGQLSGLTGGESWLGLPDDCGLEAPTPQEQTLLVLAADKLGIVFEAAADHLELSLSEIARSAIGEVTAVPRTLGNFAKDQVLGLLPDHGALIGGAIGVAAQRGVDAWVDTFEGLVLDDVALQMLFIDYALGWKTGLADGVRDLVTTGGREAVVSATADLEQLCADSARTMAAMRLAMIPPFLEMAATSADRTAGAVSERYSVHVLFDHLGGGAVALTEVRLPTDVPASDAPLLRSTPDLLTQVPVRFSRTGGFWYGSHTSAGVDLGYVQLSESKELWRIALPDEEALLDLQRRWADGDEEARAELDALELQGMSLIWGDILVQTTGLSLDELGVPVIGPG